MPGLQIQDLLKNLRVDKYRVGICVETPDLLLKVIAILYWKITIKVSVLPVFIVN